VKACYSNKKLPTASIMCSHYDKETETKLKINKKEGVGATRKMCKHHAFFGGALAQLQTMCKYEYSVPNARLSRCVVAPFC